MKIVLVQPKVCAEAAYPLGLASLVPSLYQSEELGGASGMLLYGVDLNFDSWATVLQRMADADAVGISVMTRALPQVRKLISDLRKEARGAEIPVVIGGPHPTLFPRASLEQTGADAAVTGDGELVFPKLVSELLYSIKSCSYKTNTSLPGVAWRFEDRIENGPPAEPLELDALPFPDRRVFPIARYSRAMRSLATPYTTMVSSRGCRRHCNFCPAPKLRASGFAGRSRERVYEEMAYLAGHLGVKDIHLEDDDPIADRPRFEALCELLIRRPLPLIWECVNGIPPERVDAELLRLMARAGCRSLVFSIENLHPRANGASLGHQLSSIRELVLEAHRLGIRVGGYFILGLPGESLFDMVRTIGGSYRLGLSRANYTPYQWLPGSRHWEARSSLEASAPPGSVASRLATAGHIGFYLQPRPLFGLLEDIRQQPDVLPALLKKGVELLGK